MSQAEEEAADVLVIGGGVAGITAALDLADRGLRVYLVERNPSIGGRMAQLDKTFPTLDCSICILAPKMVEVSRHPNIQMLTYSEVEDVKQLEGEDSYQVTVLVKPRYVDGAKCKGCGICVEKCPIKGVPSEFEVGIGKRKAIYIPFPQAVPLTATIDPESCLYFTKGVCEVCKKFCPSDAVVFEQKEKRLKVNVPSIIVATGFDLLDPSVLPQYGYGKFPDVLMSLQYERMMNAAGPTGGSIVKPSNGKKPDHVVLIQCIGSRNEKVKPYCSQICCMYATKQAMITKEHDPSIKVTILYNDLKVTGKGQDELMVRAREEFQVEYVKGLPGEVVADGKKGKLNVRYTDMVTGETKTVEADVVVLCPAVIPSGGSDKLAKTLGVETDAFGFFKPVDVFHPLNTKTPGVYLCGACQAPKCITHSVTQASAAAALAASKERPKKVQKSAFNGGVEIKPSEPPAGASPRIGVFVCHCGVNIASVVNVEDVVKYAATLPDVVYAEGRLFACSKDSQEAIKEAVTREKLNRVVVAACTPRTHEPLFRKTCEEAGLNPYLFEMANIREHDSWVHPRLVDEGTEKAKDLLRMAVTRSRMLEPLTPLKASVTPSALVVGGGLSGLTAARTIAEEGFNVYIIDKLESLGGRTKDAYRVPLNDLEARSYLQELVGETLKNPNVKVLTSTTLKEVKGSIGKFEVLVQHGQAEEKLEVGTIILATGAEELKPTGLYGYGVQPDVYTLKEFEEKLQKGEAGKGRTAAYILCAGARETEGRNYCSITCCAEALDQALRLKETSPDMEVYVVYRDMRLPFNGEKKFLEAREKGVVFIRYLPEKSPTLTREKNLVLSVYDSTSCVDLRIPVDCLVLAIPLVPPAGNKDLASTLKVPLSISGFFLEAHPKLRPVDFATDGIFLCGTAYGPQTVEERVFQGLAAASRALIPLTRGEVVSEPIVAVVDEDLCIGCGNCEPVCKYGAVEIFGGICRINPLICKGCGTCAVECSARAITMKHYKDEQLSEMVRAALTPLPKPDEIRVIGFLCNWCSYAGADMAGVSRFKYPPQLRVVRVMCSGRVEQLHLIEAFRRGADGVLVAGCHLGDCHYIAGNYQAERRVKQLRKLLKEAGIEEGRLRLEWISAGEGKKFAEVVKQFTEEVKKTGPNPLRR